jgi:hypothetical protein
LPAADDEDGSLHGRGEPAVVLWLEEAAISISAANRRGLFSLQTKLSVIAE